MAARMSVKLTQLNKGNAWGEVHFRNGRYRLAVLFPNKTFNWIGFAATVDQTSFKECMMLDLNCYSLAEKKGDDGYTLLVPNPRAVLDKQDTDALGYFNSKESKDARSF
jgi:hypothetical protein